jgi:hypothetical protein
MGLSPGWRAHAPTTRRIAGLLYSLDTYYDMGGNQTHPLVGRWAPDVVLPDGTRYSWAPSVPAGKTAWKPLPRTPAKRYWSARTGTSRGPAHPRTAAHLALQRWFGEPRIGDHAEATGQ